MTDQLMDARLRAAGEAWRAAVEPASDASASEPVDVFPAHPRRPRRLAWLLSAAVVAAALVAGGVYVLQGGGEPSATFAVPLRGTVWRLVGVGASSAPASLATLSIDKDGTLVADDGCTLLGIHVDVSNGQLWPNGRFDERSRDCAKRPGPVSFAGLSDTLAHAPAYSLTGERLTIGTLRFVAARLLPAPTMDVPTFVGATWRLMKVADVQGHEQAVTGGPALKLVNGELTVNDGCKTYTGAAGANGRQVQWKPLFTTANLCSGSNSVVDAVFDRTSAEQRTNGTTLTISNAGGTLTYQWVPSDKAATDPAQLTDKTWQLVSAAGNAVSPQQATLRIDKAGRLTGTDACDELSGTATVDAGSITVAGFAARAQPAVSCALMPATESVLREKASLWAIRNGELVIYGPGPQGNSLVYRRAEAPPSTPRSDSAPEILTGTWTLNSIETATAHSGSGSSVQFPDTLRYAGAAGMRLREPCEQFTIPITLDRSTITFGQRTSDGIFHCGPDTGALNQETAAVDRVVNGTVHWSISGGLLTLTKGGTTLTFTR